MPNVTLTIAALFGSEQDAAAAKKRLLSLVQPGLISYTEVSIAVPGVGTDYMYGGNK